MKEFKTGIYGLLAGSAFNTAIGGRLYDGRAPQNPVAPYVVFFIIGSVPDRTFTEDMTEGILQFSIFSVTSEQTEILDAGKKLIALYDKATIVAAGWKQIFVELANGEGEVTDYPIDTIAGTNAYFQNVVEFNIRLSRA